MKEVWKYITGYEGRYSISNTGKVKSYVYGEKLRKNVLTREGYHKVALWGSDGKCKSFFVHRIIASEFLTKTPGEQVNHKNGIKTDNRPENLEWCTTYENNEHARINKLRPSCENHWNCKLKKEEVLLVKNYPRYRGFIKDLAHVLKVHRITVLDIVHGRTWVNL